MKKWWWVAPLILGIALIMWPKKAPVELTPPPHASGTWAKLEHGSQLKMLLQGFGVETMVDVPSSARAPFKKLKHYIGIAPTFEQARSLQKQHGDETTSFYFRKLTEDLLPRADLICCWDHLATLSPQEIRAAIVQLKKSGSRFLMMSHYPEVAVNEVGEGFSPINWCISPYNFPEPIIQIAQDDERFLALWKLESIP